MWSQRLNLLLMVTSLLAVVSSEFKDTHQPTDPPASEIVIKDINFKNQLWYLGPNGMNVTGAWSQCITGDSVRVLVVDEPVNVNHAELRHAYNKSLSRRTPIQHYGRRPRQRSNDKDHGTMSAGVISNSKDGKCGVGIAFGAQIGVADVDFEKNLTDADEKRVLGVALSKAMDVVSCSWGPGESNQHMGRLGPKAAATLQEGIQHGRKGKGIVYLWAAGNGGINGNSCGYDGYVNSRYTIAIGGLNRTDSPLRSGERCGAMMAVTYSQDNGRTDGIWTSGGDGCTERFTDSSAATPMAAGIVALALQANPELTWRDVQHLIVETSDAISPKTDWHINGAGHRVSPRVGFGLLNAGRMVERARTWNNVPPERSCAISSVSNECVKGTSNIQIPAVGLVFSFKVDSSCGVDTIESVELQVDINFAPSGHIRLSLTHGNMRSVLLSGRRQDVFKNKLNWTMSSLHFWGENPKDGLWTLALEDAFPDLGRARDGLLNTWSVTFHGARERGTGDTQRGHEAISMGSCPTKVLSKTGCGAGNYSCRDSGCYDVSKRCDGYKDCTDNSDEEDCPHVCGRDYYPCRDKCYLQSYHCQPGRQDNCYNPTQCSTHVTTKQYVGCKSGEKHCQKEKKCISSSQFCDGHRDCSDGSDEQFCPTIGCPAGKVACLKTRRCIVQEALCNRRRECNWGYAGRGHSWPKYYANDETFCNGKTYCSNGQYMCEKEYKCYNASKQCDGQNDCADGSDEMACPTSAYSGPCSEGEYACDDGTCYPQSEHCDANTQLYKNRICYDTSLCNTYTLQERTGCPEGQRHCRTVKQCVPIDEFCNGVSDCRDDSDEQHCNATGIVQGKVNGCPDGKIACPRQNKCIQRSELCDGQQDCGSSWLMDTDESHCTKRENITTLEHGRPTPQECFRTLYNNAVLKLRDSDYTYQAEAKTVKSCQDACSYHGDRCKAVTFFGGRKNCYLIWSSQLSSCMSQPASVAATVYSKGSCHSQRYNTDCGDRTTTQRPTRPPTHRPTRPPTQRPTRPPTQRHQPDTDCFQVFRYNMVFKGRDYRGFGRHRTSPGTIQACMKDCSRRRCRAFSFYGNRNECIMDTNRTILNTEYRDGGFIYKNKCPRA